MNILITRIDERGQELKEMLAEHQIFAIHQPLFRLEVGAELPQLPSVLARLNADDYVFAVSKQAVDFATKTLIETGFRYRADLHYFTVGQQTATHFSAQSEQCVKYPITSENSEGLLALPEMQALEGKTILVLRANSGRDLFADTARARGANVQYLECYRKEPFIENMAEKISLHKRSGVDTIIATSGEILQTLYDYTEDCDRVWLLDCRLIVVSRRLAKIATQLGWQPQKVIISSKADNPSLLETVLRYTK